MKTPATAITGDRERLRKNGLQKTHKTIVDNPTEVRQVKSEPFQKKAERAVPPAQKAFAVQVIEADRKEKPERDLTILLYRGILFNRSVNILVPY